MDHCHLDQAKRLTPAQGAAPASSPWIKTPTLPATKASLQISAGTFAVLPVEKKL